MRTNTIMIVLRLCFGVALFCVAGWFGFAHRSPWIIPILGIAFTLLYIAGKWHAWRGLWLLGGIRAWVKALLPTFITQLILAGLVYLIGLGMGMGSLFSNQSIAQNITQRDAIMVLILTILGLAFSFVINSAGADKSQLENPTHPLGESTSQSAQSIANDEDAEFIIIDEPVTPENLFSSYRGWDDYTQKALTDITDHQGKKPIREPYAANDLAITAAEKRLGFKLPNKLKQLYKIKNGGLTENIMIAKTANPHRVYEDWESAFGGYEDMYALKSLRTVHDSVLDYADEDEEDMFPEGAKQMLILAQWYRVTTFLDYRTSGEPRVGIADFDNDEWKEHTIWFDNFDQFFSKFARISEEQGALKTVPPLTDQGPSVSSPVGFWIYGGTADHALDDALWANAEERLGVTLPQAIKPYLEVANGGKPYFNILPQFAGEEDAGLNPFPDGKLLGVEQWVTLKELSDRLQFTDGYQPWSKLWENADKLIVLSGSFDKALMLDYRLGDSPTLIYANNLDQPQMSFDLGSAERFLSNLRGITDPSSDQAPIGDAKLSALSLTPSKFWLSDKNSNLSEELLKTNEERLGLELPSNLKDWMLVQNGGSVRFRYLPPQKPNAYGYLNQIPQSAEWFDLFPDGISPVEKWETLEKWLQSNQEDFGEALRQKGHSQFIQDEYGDPEKIIVLISIPNRLTLLDASRDSHSNHANFVQLTKEKNGWIEAYRSDFARNIDLKAKRDEL